MTRIRSGWNRVTCHTLAVAMIVLGLTVVAPRQAHAVADAVVSGTVVDSVTAQPLASVTITDSTSGRSAMTAVQGTYSLSIPAGDHVLTAALAGYVPSSTPKLTLTAGQILSTQGFTLATYASASGVVTEKGTATGIAAVVVKFFDASTQSPNPDLAATTGPDGSWTIAHVPPGTYKVQLDATGTDFLDRWYPGKATRADAPTLSVTAGEAKVLSDSLSRRPRIKGHVALSDVGGLQPSIGTTVTATSQSGFTKTGSTDVNGDYVIAGLLDGSYQVHVAHPGFAAQWLQTSNGDSFPIQLLAADVIDLGTTYLSVGATVTGTVHLRAGVAAVVEVGDARTTAAADGTFTFQDVGASPYLLVRVYALGYEGLTRTYDFTAGQTLTLDLTPVASSQPPADATGKVVDTSGAPVVGATVADMPQLASVTTGATGSFSLPRVDPWNIYFRISAPGYVTRAMFVNDPTSMWTVVLQRAASVTGFVLRGAANDPAAGAMVQVVGSDTLSQSVRTDSDGRYTVSGLRPGYYKVAATAVVSGFSLTSYLGGAVSEPLAAYTSVAEGAVLTGRDIAISAPATLSGVVRNKGVPASRQTVGITGMGLAASATTGADGTFVITGIQPGTYRLETGLGGQVVWWDGTSDIGAGTEITIPSGASLTGYVLNLVPWYSLSGTLRSPAGKAIPNTTLAISNGSSRWTTTSDPSGVYRTTLTAGSYELGAVLTGGYVNWSPGAASPDIFTVASDVVKDFTVPDTLTVTLKVKGSDGSAPSYFTSSAYNSHAEYVAGAGSDNGTVAALGLQPGTFRITVFSLLYLPWATQLTVTASSELAVTLDVGGRIAGSTPGGASGITAINTVTGQRVLASGLGSLTSYSITALPPGDYVLTARPELASGPCGPARWYGGSSYLTAQRLHVASGTVLSGIDLSVSCEQYWSSGGDVYGDIAMPPSAPAGAVTDVVVYASSAVGWLSTSPGPDGTFDLSLIPGTYEVTAYENALGLVGHASVTVDGDSVQFVTLTMTRRGLVSGKVLGPFGEPVEAKVSNSESVVQTDSQGNFSLGGISYGGHTLTVVPTSPVYALTFFDVTVGVGSDAADIRVHTPLAGRMSGQIAPGAGTVEATVVDAAGRVVASHYFTQYLSFPSLPPGPLKVRFSGPAIVTE